MDIAQADFAILIKNFDTLCRPNTHDHVSCATAVLFHLSDCQLYLVAPLILQTMIEGVFVIFLMFAAVWF